MHAMSISKKVPREAAEAGAVLVHWKVRTYEGDEPCGLAPVYLLEHKYSSRVGMSSVGRRGVHCVDGVNGISKIEQRMNVLTTQSIPLSN